MFFTNENFLLQLAYKNTVLETHLILTMELKFEELIVNLWNKTYHVIILPVQFKNESLFF